MSAASNRVSGGEGLRPDKSEGNRTPGLRYKALNALRGIKCWYLPYLKSRYYGESFRPLLSYLFTEWKCNINCYYCYTWDNKVKGMTIETAKKSIDWLKTVGCRVVAIMGGEPLMRKEFILDVIKYGADNGFFVYLPTNGILMDREFIDHVGSNRVAAINLAVDTVEDRPGLPKNFKKIEPQFKYLVSRRERYGYIVFFNINITSMNVEDVKKLTEIAREHGIGTDYHINEMPVIEQSHYRFAEKGYWITEDYYREIDNLVDWLIEKNREGYPMVNSIEHLDAMKGFIRHKHSPWTCRAGRNSLVIRTDGTLAPCFELYASKKDWGRVFEPNFHGMELMDQKEDCNPKCLSTCNYQVSHYYNSYSSGLEWVLKHFHKGFFLKRPHAGAGTA
ncbi:MAG: radical SAM protein [Deltaproteobacteria bacterium]|nr:radical SAM protein [Deltaproteobacteria bacterium]